MFVNKDWKKFSGTMIGTFGASACANTLNQIYESQKDAMMSRTRLRPLPLGRISKSHAMAFALISGLFGTTLLSQQVRHLNLHSLNPLTSGE